MHPPTRTPEKTHIDLCHHVQNRGSIGVGCLRQLPIQTNQGIEPDLTIQNQPRDPKSIKNGDLKWISPILTGNIIKMQGHGDWDSTNPVDEGSNMDPVTAFPEKVEKQGKSVPIYIGLACPHIGSTLA
jgi:hypothetical protein